jgi:hypothetical protein
MSPQLLFEGGFLLRMAVFRAPALTTSAGIDILSAEIDFLKNRGFSGGKNFLLAHL